MSHHLSEGRLERIGRFLKGELRFQEEIAQTCEIHNPTIHRVKRFPTISSSCLVVRVAKALARKNLDPNNLSKQEIIREALNLKPMKTPKTESKEDQNVTMNIRQVLETRKMSIERDKASTEAGFLVVESEYKEKMESFGRTLARLNHLIQANNSFDQELIKKKVKPKKDEPPGTGPLLDELPPPPPLDKKQPPPPPPPLDANGAEEAEARQNRLHKPFHDILGETICAILGRVRADDTWHISDHLRIENFSFSAIWKTVGLDSRYANFIFFLLAGLPAQSQIVINAHKTRKHYRFKLTRFGIRLHEADLEEILTTMRMLVRVLRVCEPPQNIRYLKTPQIKQIAAEKWRRAGEAQQAAAPVAAP